MTILVFIKLIKNSEENEEDFIKCRLEAIKDAINEKEVEEKEKDKKKLQAELEEKQLQAEPEKKKLWLQA